MLKRKRKKKKRGGNDAEKKRKTVAKRSTDAAEVRFGFEYLAGHFFMLHE